MAATVLPANDDSGKFNPPIDTADSDLDAEGEEETDLYEMDQQLQHAVHQSYTGDTDEDGLNYAANGVNTRPQVLNGEYESDNDETEPVGAVKLLREDSASEEEYADSEAGDVDAESTDHESEAEDWEAESNGREDVETDNRSRANCM